MAEQNGGFLFTFAQLTKLFQNLFRSAVGLRGGDEDQERDGAPPSRTLLRNQTRKYPCLTTLPAKEDKQKA
jgi:hypothetical protein